MMKKPNYCLRLLQLSILFTSLQIATAQTNHTIQHPATPVQEKMIGMTCPDVTITALDGEKHRLSDFKGKALVLNLMSLYCGTCVSNMPRISQLSEQMQDSLRIFFIVPEDRKLIQTYLGRLPRIKNILPHVIRDTLLNAYFPHRIVPHVIWLDKNRKIMAITEDREVTQQNLRTLYAGEPMVIYHKIDDPFLPMDKPVLYDQPLIKTPIFYRSAIGGMVPGGECGSGFFRDSIQQRLVVVNSSLNGMYQESGSGMWWNQILINIRETTRYKSNDTRAWDTAHTYTYELTAPSSVSLEEMHDYMREDLDRFFNVSSKIVVQPMPAYVIEAKAGGTLPSKSTSTQPNMYMSRSDTIMISDCTVAQLVAQLNAVSLMGDPIFADGTNFHVPVDLILEAPGITDPEALRRAFEQYGLTLRKKEIPVKVLMINERDPA